MQLSKRRNEHPLCTGCEAVYNLIDTIDNDADDLLALPSGLPVTALDDVLRLCPASDEQQRRMLEDRYCLARTGGPHRRHSLRDGAPRRRPRGGA